MNSLDLVLFLAVLTIIGLIGYYLDKKCFTIPPYDVVKDCSEHGFEIRFDGGSIYHHVKDQEVYDKYMQDRCDQFHREWDDQKSWESLQRRQSLGHG
jgi:hypothetical protein